MLSDRFDEWLGLGNRFTWNISTHPRNRAQARLPWSALRAIFTIHGAKGIRMNRLGCVTLGKLMTLSPKTKEVQIKADIHTHWYIRKRRIYTTPVESASSNIWSEEEVLTHMGLLSRHLSHFPWCLRKFARIEWPFCSYITLEASPDESRIRSVKNGRLLLSENVFQVRIKEFPGLFPKRSTVTSAKDTSGAAPDSPRVAAIKACCQAWLLRAVARVELILFLINISFQTIHPIGSGLESIGILNTLTALANSPVVGFQGFEVASNRDWEHMLCSEMSLLYP